MEQSLHTIEEAAKKILEGRKLLLAGDESALARLPKGEWIGGTIPYFMAEQGGVATRDRVFVTELPAFTASVTIRAYDQSSIRSVYQDLPEDGFGVIIIPAATAIHQAFALEAPNYPDFAAHPLVGWISGVHLSDLGKVTPKVFLGPTGECIADGAVAALVALPPGKTADIGIVNIFAEGKADAIVFPESGFKVVDAIVNGERRNFAEYVRSKGLDTKLPLVADYCGAKVNVSFQSVDPDKGEVVFYAPVFQDMEYKPAHPFEDYVAEFEAQVPKAADAGVLFSCNCILNYLYSGLEGKHTGAIVGPITFGEVAYQLMNQTLVYVNIIDAVA